MLWEDFANRKLEEIGFLSENCCIKSSKCLKAGYCSLQNKFFDQEVLMKERLAAGFVSAPMNPPGIHLNQTSNSAKIRLESETKRT